MSAISKDQSQYPSPRRFYSQLISWAEEHLRVFPWRNCSDPYKVFISEFLLRRTTSKAANRAFTVIVKKYPNISSLATANSIESDLKTIGLHIQRNKQILEAAKYIIEKEGGEIPSDVNGLASIPGVGTYSSNAIASFAFGGRAPVVDSNVRRVLRRVTGEETIRDHSIVRYLSSAISGKKSSIFNYAIIDLGAMVCKPSRPTCFECPLRNLCNYHLKTSLKSAKPCRG